MDKHLKNTLSLEHVSLHILLSFHTEITFLRYINKK